MVTNLAKHSTLSPDEMQLVDISVVSEVERLRKDVEVWRARALKAENELSLMTKLRRAPVLKPIDKAIIEEFRHVETYGKVKDGDGHTRVNFRSIAERLHTSPDTVSRRAERISKLGLVEIHEHQGVLDEHARKYIQVDATKLASIDRLEDAENIIPKQGGNRYQCQQCESHHVAIRSVRTLLCLDCNHETILTDTGYVDQNVQKAQKQLAFQSETVITEVEVEENDSEKQNAAHMYTQVLDLLFAPGASDNKPERIDDPQQNAEKQVAFTASDCLASSETTETTVTPTVYSVALEVEQVEPPQFLRDKKIWCTRIEKVPYVPELPRREPRKAKNSDPRTWGTYEQAKAMYEQSLAEKWKTPFDGIGCMNDGSFVMLDYDHCIEQGMMSEETTMRLDEIASYAELSPSGTGVHQFVLGSIPESKKTAAIEMYQAKRLDNSMMERGRFLTWTGKHIVGTPLTIEARQEELDTLYGEIAPVKLASKRDAAPRGTCVSPGIVRTDDEVLDAAKRAGNGAKFERLWSGDTTGYASQSNADMALCGILAFWTNNDEQIDRLFRRSKLYRSKWDSKRGSETYGSLTIRTAIEKRLAR